MAEDEIEYENDPEEAKLSLQMRRRFASEDEGGEAHGTPRRRDDDSNGESEGAVAEYEDECEEEVYDLDGEYAKVVYEESANAAEWAVEEKLAGDNAGEFSHDNEGAKKRCVRNFPFWHGLPILTWTVSVIHVIRVIAVARHIGPIALIGVEITGGVEAFGAGTVLIICLHPRTSTQTADEDTYDVSADCTLKSPAGLKPSALERCSLSASTPEPALKLEGARAGSREAHV